MLQLALYVGLAIGVSFLCSLLEAALLSVRIATLADLQRAGSRGAAFLLNVKRTRIDDAISAILVVNTVANTLGATLAGWKAAEVFGSKWVGAFSGVLTFAILVLSEIVPKTLGTVYAGRLAPFVGHALRVLTAVMLPVLWISRGLTRMLTRNAPRGFSRGELSAVIETATRDGALTRDEYKVFENLLRLREVQIEDVMTPRTVVTMLPEDATVADLLRRTESETFSRIPLYRDDTDNVLGYVLVRDVLARTVRTGQRDRPLSDFLREVTFIPELATVDAALKRMLERNEPIAMVTDEHGGLAGLVTLEDLTETVLGVEIVDESDRAVDMRQVAMELRDRRLARMRRKREIAETSTEEEPSPPVIAQRRGPID